eukprot:7381266-Prymnesium_polylepis.1
MALLPEHQRIRRLEKLRVIDGAAVVGVNHAERTKFSLLRHGRPHFFQEPRKLWSTEPSVSIGIEQPERTQERISFAHLTVQHLEGVLPFVDLKHDSDKDGQHDDMAKNQE